VTAATPALRLDPLLPDGGSPPPLDRDRFLARHLTRWVLLVAFLAALAVAAPDAFDLPTVAVAALLAFSIDLQHPVALRNMFLVYSVGLFWYGNRLIYPSGSSLAPDLLLYLLAFSAGYVVYTSVAARRPPPSTEDAAPPADPDAVTARLELVLWLLFGIQMLRVVALIAPYGPQRFYGGQELVNRISSFGQGGSTGVQGITTILVTVAVAAVVAVYAEHCVRAGVAVRYRLVVLAVLVPPLFSLERASVVYGSVLLAALYLCERRARDPGGPGSRPLAGNGRRVVVAVVVLLCAMGVAIKFGDIRAKRISQDVFAQGGETDTLQQVLRSEFTTIVFYRDVKENIDFLGYRYGSNIVGAFATRLVPRSLWRDKPITTTDYYMRQLRPQELQAGFSLAPSLFGVALLNFGVGGTMVLLALIGIAAAACDRGYVQGMVSRLPQFLIVATWFYSLLRDDLSTSLASITVTFVAYALLRRAVADASTRHPATA
jgi:hypothetical protein